jgi:hypothetical protein
MRVRRSTSVLGSAFLAMALVLGSPSARADGASEAYSHFQRAVTLYGESDFTAALAEFKRAYALAPANSPGTVNVLYNIGQTQFQLQKYADALATFEKYVSDEGTTTHRAEAESTIATLRDRVGRIDVTTNVPAEIQIDDEVIGKTPLPTLRASIGRRKITATAEGSLPATTSVDVTSGEAVAVSLKLMVNSERVAEARPARNTVVEPATLPAPKRTAAIVGWVATGALGAGVAVTGLLALQSSKNLMGARDAFPANKNTVQSDASTTTALSVTTDALGLATILLGGLSIYWTVSSAPSHAVRVGTTGNGLRVFGTF